MNVCRALGFVFLVVLTSCAQHSYRNDEVIVNSTAAALSFEGRGAGAGMMLMSSMGPAGIAVGVAIDVGIGKDIDKAVTLTGVTFADLVGDKLLGGCPYIENFNDIEKLTSVTVKKYGFKTAKGSADNVVAWFTLSVNNEELLLHYPADFQKEKGDLPSLSFDLVKSDGQQAVTLWQDSLALVCGY